MASTDQGESTNIHTITAELPFYPRVHDFTPVDPLPPVEIDVAGRLCDGL